jgi:uncharacterized protein (TIGR03083 family)
VTEGREGETAGTDPMVTAFRSLRSRVNGLLEDLDDAQADAFVPATPEWRVHDLLSHFAGVAEDVVQGNIEGAGSDPWTAAQVDARRDRAWAEVIAEWNERAVALEAMMPDIPEFQRGQLVFDAVTHEHDLRGAVGRPGERDTDAMAIGWDWATAIVGMMRDGNAAGALRIRTEQGEQVVGQGDVTATVSADRFDLFRAMTGRRSVEQVKAFAWEGGTHVGHLCFLPCTPVDLVE